MNTKKATFTLPIELLIYLQTKENQAAFVTEAIRKLKEEEEANQIKKASKEMEELKEIWDELEDWDITLSEDIDE